MVLQYPAESGWTWRAHQEDEIETPHALSYVPIDPCQPVIAAIRSAMGEHLPCAFIDQESSRYIPHTLVVPDPYAVKRISLDRFATAILPSIKRPGHARIRARIQAMGKRLCRLEVRYRRILCLCAVVDWPWLREAYQAAKGEASPARQTVENDSASGEPSTEILEVSRETRLFLLSELPFITALYERARSRLDDDTNLSIDGVKELLRAARESYAGEFGRRAKSISLEQLRRCLKYVRNLTLLDRRLSPDLYHLVVAAKQTVSDGFAMHVAERARDYLPLAETGFPVVELGVDQARLPGGAIVPIVSRLPGPPILWRALELNRRPDPDQQRRWQMQWNPFEQCSWPPEDERIENFRTHVVDRARAILGTDLARSEKFSSSLKDGIDLRETLRNWHTGELHVKVLPPIRGPLDVVVMLFDVPADPRDYRWRTTWFAEHAKESTLAFFATDYRSEPVGPGICLAHYGGALFLFPPKPILDVWRDPRFDFAETLEERLLAAACLHSESRHIALLSPLPPGPGWRRLARRFRKKWVHVPLSSMGQSTIDQLRLVHVLNGRSVRSYAADFIRRP